MEMDCMFWGENEKSFFKLDPFQKNRTLIKPFYPYNNIDYLQNKKKLKSKKSSKQVGELRIIGFDVALMGGKDNDNSVFTLMRLLPTPLGYERHIVYVEHLNGVHSTKQAIRLHQLFNDFEADFVAMDTQGNGISVYEDLVKVLYDDERDEEYKAWTCVNNGRMAERSQDINAVPVIYSYKASGTPQLNHEIATSLRSNLHKGKVKFLVSQLEGQEFWSEKPEYENGDDSEKAMLLRPYQQTTTMINETINLEYTVSGGWFVVYETGRNRKDRYCSLAYANYLADSFERDLNHDNYDPDDDIVYY